MPFTLTRDISPPPRLSKRQKTLEAASSGNGQLRDATPFATEPALAAVEAGKAKIEAHLAYFKEHLAKVSRPPEGVTPRLAIKQWASLYESNEHEHGNHFVIHQHNHPVSGVHCK